MPTYRVIHPNNSPAPNVKVMISYKQGGTKDGRTDRNGYISLSGSSAHGKIYVDGRKGHEGSLMSNMEFIRYGDFIVT